MSKSYLSISFLLGINCLSFVVADEAGAEITTQSPYTKESVELKTPTVLEPFFAQPTTPQLPAIVNIAKPFSPFTGQVKGKKVRLRVSADLEGRVVKELSRQDLLVVVGEKDDFYAVEPPAGTKAYVFRSFVLDGIVEGNRVNVRLEPSIEAPVIGHLNSGDRIKETLSSLNNKWYEITPPPGTRFYVAKEYIESIGGPEVKAQVDKRRMTAEQLLDAAALLTAVEMRKSYREIDIERIKHNYQTVMDEYTEFTDLCDKAKENSNNLQEEYIQRKIAYLEDKAEERPPTEFAPSTAEFEASIHPTDRMKMWEPIEESIYLSWASLNIDRSIDEFYDEQKQEAIILSGMVELYSSPVKCKPGDYILKDNELPKAYLYSTHINLHEYVGKKVSILAAPRSNNNFAFPAYFVLSVE